MGIPAFWASSFPKLRAVPSHITLAVWVKVRVTGDAHITRVLGMGIPETRGCYYHCYTGATIGSVSIGDFRNDDRKLDRVNFRKDLWNEYWGQGKFSQ